MTITLFSLFQGHVVQHFCRQKGLNLKASDLHSADILFEYQTAYRRSSLPETPPGKFVGQCHELGFGELLP
jgi:hypothetical protein